MERVTRAERLRQITELRGRGLNTREIALELGVTAQSVRNTLYDPDGAKARARKASYAGVCRDCGRPTDGSNGREKAPTLCLRCVRGERPSQPSLRRCVPVRLADLPLEQMRVAA